MTQYVQEKVERLESPIIAWALLGIIAALLLSYAYFINGAVTNMVSAKSVRTEIAELTSRTGALEAEYMTKQSEMDLSYAHSLGLKEANDAIYVAKSQTAPLSFNR